MSQHYEEPQRSVFGIPIVLFTVLLIVMYLVVKGCSGEKAHEEAHEPAEHHAANYSAGQLSAS